MTLTADTSGAHYDTLLEIVDSISDHRDVPSLLQRLSDVLSSVVRFDVIAILTYDMDREAITQLSVEAGVVQRASEVILAEGSAHDWHLLTERAILVSDVEASDTPVRVIDRLREGGFRSALFLPLTTAVRNTGVLAFGARHPGAYDGVDLDLLRRVATQVAVAVDNARHAELAVRQRAELERERERWRVLLDVTNALASHLDLDALLAAVTPCLRRTMSFDLASIALYDAQRHALRHVATHPPPDEGQLLESDEFVPLDGTALGHAFASGEPLLANDLRPEVVGQVAAAAATRHGVRSGCAIPLIGPRRTIGAFMLAARDEGRFSADDLELLGQVGRQIGLAIENALAYRDIAELTNRLAREKEYLEDEIRSGGRFDEIIGHSPALRSVLAQVEDVAPNDTTVLLLGETGTGKELFARAIHQMSPRNARTLVKVNCAAIPSGLLESELFGHEKGAFTGALDRRLGRFELADGGTIFLDEIGDIPLELQTKLLRVLQEREFERLGNARSLKVDVRVIAATNQDLPRLVADRRFRRDLYYRLNVFPIMIPPLRERRSDVPLLVRHFVQKYARRLRKPIDRIPTEAIEALEAWNWPGNVRELESVIERALIRSRHGVLHVMTSDLESEIGGPATDPDAGPQGTLDAIERQHILRVLADTKWVVGGPKGAAVRLGLNRNTLVSRMRKLGVTRPTP